MIYWTEEKQLQIESLLFIYAEASYFRLHDKNLFFISYNFFFLQDYRLFTAFILFPAKQLN